MGCAPGHVRGGPRGRRPHLVCHKEGEVGVLPNKPRPSSLCSGGSSGGHSNSRDAGGPAEADDVGGSQPPTRCRTLRGTQPRKKTLAVRLSSEIVRIVARRLLKTYFGSLFVRIWASSGRSRPLFGQFEQDVAKIAPSSAKIHCSISVQGRISFHLHKRPEFGRNRVKSGRTPHNFGRNRSGRNLTPSSADVTPHTCVCRGRPKAGRTWAELGPNLATLRSKPARPWSNLAEPRPNSVEGAPKPAELGPCLAESWPKFGRVRSRMCAPKN